MTISVLFCLPSSILSRSSSYRKRRRRGDEFRKLYEWFVEQKTTRNRTTIGVSEENEEFSAAIVRETCFFPFSGNRTQKRRNKNTNSRQIHAQTHKWWICLLQNFDRVNFCWSFFSLISNTRFTNDKYTYDPSLCIHFCEPVWHFMWVFVLMFFEFNICFHLKCTILSCGGTATAIK